MLSGLARRHDSFETMATSTARGIEADRRASTRRESKYRELVWCGSYGSYALRLQDSSQARHEVEKVDYAAIIRFFFFKSSENALEFSAPVEFATPQRTRQEARTFSVRTRSDANATERSVMLREGQRLTLTPPEIQ